MNGNYPTRRTFIELAAATMMLASPLPALADELAPADEQLGLAEGEEPLEYAADEAEPLEANSGGTVNVYRLFNRRTSEHLYTTSYGEYGSLPRKSNGDWMWEGVAWVAPKKSSTPVYRLYNRGLGDHHYTTSTKERDALTRKGWKYEGVAFYSDDSKRVPLYRVYNRRLKAGQHHYTTSKSERNNLVNSSGWRSEGVGWYAVKKGHCEDLSKYRVGYVYDDGSFTAVSWGSAATNMKPAQKNYLAYMLYRLKVVGVYNPNTDVIDVWNDGTIWGDLDNPQSPWKYTQIILYRRSGSTYRDLGGFRLDWTDLRIRNIYNNSLVDG